MLCGLCQPGGIGWRITAGGSYFPRVIKNRGRGLPPALSRVVLARHTRTRAGSEGPLWHARALFPAVHEETLSRTPKNELFVKVAFLGKLEASSSPKAAGGSGGLLAQSLRFRCVAEL